MVRTIMKKVTELGYSNPMEMSNLDDINALIDFIEVVKSN
jgi:hypothetical protein